MASRLGGSVRECLCAGHVRATLKEPGVARSQISRGQRRDDHRGDYESSAADGPRFERIRPQIQKRADDAAGVMYPAAEPARST